MRDGESPTTGGARLRSYATTAARLDDVTMI